MWSHTAIPVPGGPLEAWCNLCSVRVREADAEFCKTCRVAYAAFCERLGLSGETIAPSTPPLRQTY